MSLCHGNRLSFRCSGEGSNGVVPDFRVMMDDRAGIHVVGDIVEEH